MKKNDDETRTGKRSTLIALLFAATQLYIPLWRKKVVRKSGPGAKLVGKSLQRQIRLQLGNVIIA